MKTTHSPAALTQAGQAEMASFQGWPCLSLHLPSHRRHPDNSTLIVPRRRIGSRL